MRSVVLYGLCYDDTANHFCFKNGEMFQSWDLTCLLKCIEMIYDEKCHQVQKGFYVHAVGHTILPGSKGEVTEACDLAESPHSFL